MKEKAKKEEKNEKINEEKYLNLSFIQNQELNTDNMQKIAEEESCLKVNDDYENMNNPYAQFYYEDSSNEDNLFKLPQKKEKNI